MQPIAYHPATEISGHLPSSHEDLASPSLGLLSPGFTGAGIGLIFHLLSLTVSSGSANPLQTLLTVQTQGNHPEDMGLHIQPARETTETSPQA